MLYLYRDSDLEDYTFVMGSVYRTKPDEHRQSRYAALIVAHPNYDDKTYDNDIALAKLGAPVTLTEYVRPVCLPKQGQTPAYGDECYLTGWGRLTDGGENIATL